MEEWQKILISTFAGFFAGVIAEPVKAVLSLKVKRTQMRRALYKNLAAAQGLLRWISGCDSNPKLVGEQLSARQQRSLDAMNNILIEVFEHYYDNEKPLFFTISEAVTLLNIFEAIARLRDNVDSDYNTRVAQARNIVKHLDLCVDRGEISGRLLSHYKAQNDKEFEKSWMPLIPLPPQLTRYRR